MERILSLPLAPIVPSPRAHFFRSRLAATCFCSIITSPLVPPLALPGVHTSSPLHSPTLAPSRLLCPSSSPNHFPVSLTCSLSQHQVPCPFQPLIAWEAECSPGQPLQLEPAAEPGVGMEGPKREGQLRGCLVYAQHQHSANILGERHLEVLFLGGAV